MSGEVWYSVGPNDVFPETFGPFLLGNPAVREVFMAHHADLLDAAFWQGHKERILAGYVHRCVPLRRAQALRAARRAAAVPSEPVCSDCLISLSKGAVHVRFHRHRFRRPHAHRRHAGRLLRACRASSSARVAIKAAVERAGVTGDAVDEVLIGNCLMAGQGQAPARQAALGAGLPDRRGAVTLSKMCGSGMRAMMFAHDMLLAGSADVMVAGGMESMTNAPHLMLRERRATATAPRSMLRPHGARRPGRRLRAGPRDGRVRARNASPSTSSRARRRTRFAIARTERAKKANEDGSFDWEIAPVTRAGQGRRDGGRSRRAAVQGQARQDPDAEAGVQERRHDHRGRPRRASPTAPPRWC